MAVLAPEPFLSLRTRSAVRTVGSLRSGWTKADTFLLLSIGILPVWWVLGFAQFLWGAIAFPLFFMVLRLPEIRLPRGSGLWMLYIGWTILSASQLDELNHVLAYVYRMTVLFGAALLFVYLYNQPAEQVPRERVIGWMCVFWAWIALGGLLGVLAPNFTINSVAHRLLVGFLPGDLGSNGWFVSLTTPRAAQVQDFLGFPLPRPAAPFSYTNEWGSCFAFTAPFAFAGLLIFRGWRRSLLLAVTLIAFVPAIVSLNRGLWVTVIVGGLYFAVRSAWEGRPQAAVTVGAIGAILGLLIVVTPMRTLVEGRFESDHSNVARLTLYTTVAQEVQHSPLFGYGVPRVSEDYPNLPAIGTHGHFWTALYSQGIPGLLLFLAASLSSAWRSGARCRNDRVGTWMHIVVSMVLVEMWFYEFLPAQWFIVVVAMALALRAPAGSLASETQTQGSGQGRSVRFGDAPGASAQRSAVPLMAFEPQSLEPTDPVDTGLVDTDTRAAFDAYVSTPFAPRAEGTSPDATADQRPTRFGGASDGELAHHRAPHSAYTGEPAVHGSVTGERHGVIWVTGTAHSEPHTAQDIATDPSSASTRTRIATRLPPDDRWGESP